MGVFYIKW